MEKCDSVQQGILIVLSGPSGAGKGTLCRELLLNNDKLHYSISATTRAAREGETNGVNYWFVSKEEFQTMIQKDELLEWAEVYGNYYGTPLRYVKELLDSGKDVILEIDTQGAMLVKNRFPQGVFIYILPPSLDELADRIYKRGTDSLEVIKKRLGCVHSELTCVYNYDYVVVNDQIAPAVKKLENIIIADKCRVDRNERLIASLCNCETVTEIKGGL